MGRADLGAGNNRVLGDLGTITTTGTLGDDEIQSSDPNLGGNDKITTAGGADIVIAGEGLDSIATGAGNDVALARKRGVMRLRSGTALQPR